MKASTRNQEHRLADERLISSMKAGGCLSARREKVLLKRLRSWDIFEKYAWLYAIRPQPQTMDVKKLLAKGTPSQISEEDGAPEPRSRM